jgi:4a-hydroxytetrahydrobiopterin dehydratase
MGEASVLLGFSAEDEEIYMPELAEKKCIPCRGGVPPLSAQEITALIPQTPGWAAVDQHHVEREFKFKNFREALDFTNHVGELAEEQGHHPDIYLAWGKVKIEIWTHKIDGLTESDFILAAKINRLPGA